MEPVIFILINILWVVVVLVCSYFSYLYGKVSGVEALMVKKRMWDTMKK